VSDETRSAAEEIAARQRFEFGENWREFIDTVDDGRVADAVAALRDMLGEPVDGTFLDAGCGSGLSSLAARRLGATVVSFDFDPQSVLATRELRHRFAPEDDDWSVREGSVLDQDFLEGLGTFDVVYSWGVLHHTGEMWRGIDLVADRVAPGGRLFIAIYNDQGGASERWRSVKKVYNRSGAAGQAVITGAAALYFGSKAVLANLARGRLPKVAHRPERGMSYWHDLRDWVGGYPFEVAKPEEVFDQVTSKGFVLERLKTCAGGLGCNEYVFSRSG
jgi:2-polyprenyl-6-hydroxyphenyl methylase/3-demethylubiquinone-9 3-methyltransferase